MERMNGIAGRKLALNKETLRTLGDAELRDAAGGIPSVVVGSVLVSVIVTATLTTTVTLTPGPNTTTNPTNTAPPDDPKEPKAP